MSHPFARRAGALALTAALFVQQAGALSNISSGRRRASQPRRLPA